MTEEIKAYIWELRKESTDEWVIYNSQIGPVTEDHVRNSPMIKRWADGGKFEARPFKN